MSANKIVQLLKRFTCHGSYAITFKYHEQSSDSSDECEPGCPNNRNSRKNPRFLRFLEQAGTRLRLQLHGAIYRPDSFVLMLCYCANLKAIRYQSTSFNRIVANKSHRVIVTLK